MKGLWLDRPKRWGFSDEAGNSVCLLGDFEAKCFHSATLTHRHRSPFHILDDEGGANVSKIALHSRLRILPIWDNEKGRCISTLMASLHVEALYAVLLLTTMDGIVVILVMPEIV